VFIAIEISSVVSVRMGTAMLNTDKVFHAEDADEGDDSSRQ
jgi:hypothetical protein